MWFLYKGFGQVLSQHLQWENLDLMQKIMSIDRKYELVLVCAVYDLSKP
jgi:hypothetical protein